MRNPKPVRLDDLVLDGVYVICGNGVDPLEFTVRYHDNELKISSEIKAVESELLAYARDRAGKFGSKFFNGPTVRLLRITEENARQDADGREAVGHVLELAPVNWFQYTILNDLIDLEFSQIGNRKPSGRRSPIMMTYSRANAIYVHCLYRICLDCRSFQLQPMGSESFSGAAKQACLPRRAC
jgi:hypothetical protein